MGDFLAKKNYVAIQRGTGQAVGAHIHIVEREDDMACHIETMGMGEGLGEADATMGWEVYTVEAVDSNNRDDGIPCGIVVGKDEEEGDGMGKESSDARVRDILQRLRIKERMAELHERNNLREKRWRLADLDLREREQQQRSKAMDDVIKGLGVLEELSMCNLPDKEFVGEMERKVKEAMLASFDCGKQ